MNTQPTNEQLGIDDLKKIEKRLRYGIKLIQEYRESFEKYITDAQTAGYFLENDESILDGRVQHEAKSAAEAGHRLVWELEKVAKIPNINLMDNSEVK
jgi:hypothetical protein